MKRLLLFASATAAAASLAACSPSSTAVETHAPTAHQTEGGINGGGGGTLPAQPITTSEVHDVIRNAKVDLALYYKLQLSRFSSATSSASYKKVYGARPNLFDALYSTNIEVPDDRPCYDADGNAVDGSIHASTPHTICISAFTIAPKLIAERARTEILALITHELSHTLGADEDEARDLQKDLSLTYQPIPGHLAPDVDSYLDALFPISEDIEHHTHSVEQSLANGSESEIEEAISKLDSDVGAFSGHANQINRSVFDSQEYDTFFLQWTRLSTLAVSVNQQNPHTAAFLDSIFKGRTQISYCEKMYGKSPCSNQFGGEMITRTMTREEAKIEFAKVAPFFEALAQNIRNLRFNSKPNALPLPTSSSNPFEAFKGEYDIVSTSCDGPVRFVDKATKFTVEENGAGRPLHLKVTVPNGWGDDGEFESGAVMSWGATSTSIAGGQDWAERASETGDRWGSTQLRDYYQETTRLEKSGATYKLTRTNTDIHESRGQFTETTHSCTFELARLQP